MSLTYNPLSGNLETKEPGPQGPTGTVSAAGDGSEGAPSISFASDTDTGLYKYANNSIGISTGSTTQIVINSAGRLGLGVTNPGENLTVGGEDNPTIRLHTSRQNDSWSDTSKYGSLQWYSNDFEFNSGGEMASISAGVDNNFGQRPSLRFYTTTSLSSGAVPTERMRLDTFGNLKIGGTLPSAPNINLGNTGTATFSAGVTADYFATDTTAGFFNFYRNQGSTSALNTAWGTTGGAQKIKFYNNGAAEFGSYTSSRNTDGFSILDGGAAVITRAGSGSGTAGLLVYGAGNLNAKIQSDGSATFAGQTLVGENTAGSPKVRIDPTGYVNIQSNSGTGEALRIFDPSSTQKIVLKADGSAEYAGNVQAGGNAQQGRYSGVVLRELGLVQAARPGSDSVFTGFQTSNNNTTSNATSQINADGSASFAGGQTAITSSGVIDIQSITAAADASTLFRCGSTNATAGANALVVKANGSAQFAGNLDVGPWQVGNSGSEGARIYSNGSIQTNRTSTGGAAFVGRLNGSVTSQILGDGSGTFAGNVGIGATNTLGNKLFVDGGNVRIDGAPSTDAKLEIRGDNSTSSSTDAVLSFVSYLNNNSGGSNADIRVTNAGGSYGEMIFSTRRGSGANTEAMRLTSTGSAEFAGVVSMGDSAAAGSHKLFVKNSANTTTDITYYSELLSGSNNVNASHFYGITQGVAVYRLTGNGTSTFTSDERKKKNIETTRDGYLEDLRDLRVVKYNWISQDDDAPKELGLIAQEVEQVFPGLVMEDVQMEGDDYKLKTLKGSVLPFMLLKALQEAAEKIESLEAKVAALEAN